MSKVYEEIVLKNQKKTKVDVRYLVAYSLYKKQKKEFVDNYCKENNKEPDTDTLQQFQDSCLTQTSLDNLYAQTDRLLLMYGDVVFKSKLTQFHKVHLVINGKNFWHGVSQSVVASFVFAFLLFLIGLIINFANDGGIKEVLREWLDSSG